MPLLSLLVALLATLLAGAAGAASRRWRREAFLRSALFFCAVLYRSSRYFCRQAFGAFQRSFRRRAPWPRGWRRPCSPWWERFGNACLGAPGGLICVMGFLLNSYPVYSPPSRRERYAPGEYCVIFGRIAPSKGGLVILARAGGLKTFQSIKIMQKPINWLLIFQVWRMRNKSFQITILSFQVLQWCITQ